MIRSICLCCLIAATSNCGFALEPEEILIVANANNSESLQIADYYCQKRSVPHANILKLPLGETLSDTITREGYDVRIARPIRKALKKGAFAGSIKCLLTVYGVPFRVGPKEPLPAKTSASVDSELSMLMFDDYELSRWRKNELKSRMLWINTKTLMVSRLDGPGSKIVMRLIDKALAAEKNGLKGNACFDWRWGESPDKRSQYGQYDRSIQQAAELTSRRTSLNVVTEKTSALFAPGDCPDTALYCGWYSLRKYVDAFEFVDGAVGFHIASFEAVDLREGKSSQWCPAMLVDGITATLGSVAEPYLGAFPKPDEFFAELIRGKCLVEAWYRTKPYNSWQMLLIGDPLYVPFDSAD